LSLLLAAYFATRYDASGGFGPGVLQGRDFITAVILPQQEQEFAMISIFFGGNMEQQPKSLNT
jgi:hypothetical protein